MVNPLDLSGCVIMVTGGSSGIGKAAAQLLSQLGARIVLVSRRGEALESARQTLQGGGHLVAPFDLRKLDEIEPWFTQTVANSGALHGLVHCAGTQLLRPLKLVSLADIEEMTRLTISSSLLLAKAFRRKGHHTSPASMVFLSSVMGQAGAAGRSVYCAGKASLAGMARALALELVRDGIRVNCVAPGFVSTGMLAEMDKMLGKESFEEIRKAHPLGFGEPADVAHAIAFLLARSSSWITGTTLVVDGGYTAQ